MHTALIITFMTSFLEATTYNVYKSVLFDKEQIYYEDPIVINKTLENETTELGIYNFFVTWPRLFLISFVITFGVSWYCWYSVCSHLWYQDRQRTLKGILLCIFFPCAFFSSLWRRIMELRRPPVNNEN